MINLRELLKEEFPELLWNSANYIKLYGKWNDPIDQRCSMWIFEDHIWIGPCINEEAYHQCNWKEKYGTKFNIGDPKFFDKIRDIIENGYRKKR